MSATLLGATRSEQQYTFCLTAYPLEFDYLKRKLAIVMRESRGKRLLTQGEQFTQTLFAQ